MCSINLNDGLDVIEKTIRRQGLRREWLGPVLAGNWGR